MDLADKFSVLKLNTPSRKYESYSGYSQAPPIEFISDSESAGKNGAIKANKPSKQSRKISVKKSKFQDKVVYYSSGGEVSDGEHGNSDSEIVTLPPSRIDHEWRAFCSKRAEIKAAKAAALAAALATAQTAQTA
ncbi:hypothetical protein M378DRAFT_11334 [Amanita muscaria Koide BX008]|uniref:Uncharacterized protein n=1 Tax=Amanita muscaria (strain Koide BX008) TaxID=946122 RepID=A0A0C2WS88_AMAMK|nr:hypothetical protein M378DRAFT_11334 [Amanita muscaria Koide BX008]